ncbi:MAG TPA: thioesterase family protein [Sphingobacteriaceae bacterium]|nr:thioesterase family protein [Sphingobacteriaceae bacterium]
MNTAFNYKTLIPFRFTDFDTFGHANNAVYLTYFEIARSNYWREVIHWDWKSLGIIIANAEITYIKPVHQSDQLFAYVRTSYVGNTSFKLEYILVKLIHGVEEICTKGSTVCVAYDYKTQQKVSIPDYQRAKMLEFEALV